MKCSFNEIKDSFLGYVLVAATTHLSETDQKKFFKFVRSKTLDIHFTVNGFDLPVEKVFEEIEKQMDDVVFDLTEAVSSVKELVGVADTCKRCYGLLDDDGFCIDETCPFCDCQQEDQGSWD